MFGIRVGIYLYNPSEIILKSPYDPDLTEAVKKVRGRRPLYDESRVTSTGRHPFVGWIFPRFQLSALIAAIDPLVDEIEVEGLLLGEEASSTDWVDQLYQALPEGERQRMYKALARAFHPDLNPDSSHIMVRINQVFQSLDQRLRW